MLSLSIDDGFESHWSHCGNIAKAACQSHKLIRKVRDVRFILPLQMKATSPGIYKWAQKVAHKVAIKNKKAFKKRGSWLFSDYINRIGDFDTEEMEAFSWMLDGDY